MYANEVKCYLPNTYIQHVLMLQNSCTSSSIVFLYLKYRYYHRQTCEREDTTADKHVKEKILPPTNMWKRRYYRQQTCEREDTTADKNVKEKFEHTNRVTCGMSVVFSMHSGLLHQWNRSPRYNCNIVESGVKYHNPPPLLHYILSPRLCFIEMCLCVRPVT